MEIYNGIQAFHATSRTEWRKWLEENHQSEKSVWLIIFKKESGTQSVYYPEAVDEALCFGWIDSKPNKRDENSYYQFFAKRNPKSNWSKINKAKVIKLIEQGLMHSSGYEMIEIAKKNGTWEALDEVENLTLPADLEQLFLKNNVAFENWNNFSRSSKRGILEWIMNAKRPETRQKRIEETVSLAEKNCKANHYRQ
ncbi:YdeI/OmpD-associated family protein [Cytophagales bacterium LB-30]|uniref:YdeI/OmpD-associated family protein n=1 Tax=Shiella aurantiaca TaxID=3058365 RepID=A0ABT8F4E5_9BACT|nr:YdeI/OmpD-associated family protein [Shiella aurantiaca]MDN4165114.1 YdeI/OmpD-associated family protein [Shiella aurantiaca]